MRQAVVSVDPDLLAEQGFKFDVFREAGVRDTEVISCTGPRGVLRVHVEEPVDESRLDEMDAVEWHERVASDDDEVVYLLEAGRPSATAEDEDGRLPRCEQVEVSDRGVTLTWAGPQDRLREGLADLETDDHAVSLERLRGYRADDGPLDALTERQREVLEVAFEKGYYDVPRDASVEAVADEVGLDDSTVAEHLQRAERNLLGALLEA